MTSWAQLGDISLDVIAVTECDHTFAEEYAEHARINAAPKLQHLGPKLASMSMSARFSRSWCDPDAKVEQLKATLRAGASLPFVRADGVYVGDYVITELRVTTSVSHGDGSTWMCTVAITLRESPDDLTGIVTQALAVMTGSAVPAGAFGSVADIVQPPSIFSSIKSAVQTGQQVFAAAKAASGVLDTARAFSTNPVAALERLRGGIPGFDALAAVTDKFGLNLTAIGPAVADAGTVLATVGSVAGQARSISSAIAHADVATVVTVLATATTTMGSISKSLDAASAPLARMSARIIARAVP